MKTLRLFAALTAIALVAFANTARSAEIAPEKLTEIKRMIQVTGMENLMDQMMTQTMDMMRQGVPNLPPEFLTKFTEKAKARNFIDKIIPLYDKYYTIEDLRAINTFYDSPAGKKILSTLPQIMQEFTKLGQEWGEEIAMEAMIEVMKDKKAQKAAN